MIGQLPSDLYPVAPIAIIGTALKLPGDICTTDVFWEFIQSQKIAIRDTPPDRFDIEAVYSQDPDEIGTTYSRRAGYIDDPFAFDNEFFRISLAEALEMDPQQRWLLQLCWSALENAGIPPASLRGKRVGLYITLGDVDYARRTVNSGNLHNLTGYAKLGANRAVGIGRVAYMMGFQGPAIFIDSTCSSSLATVHLAAQALRCGDCDLALAGGVNLILGPEETIGFARLGAISRSDTCRTFDGQADGYIRGEGGAIVVLKRETEAQRDKNRIDVRVIGSAINNDGASNGLTAPNGAAQEAVIRHALQQADKGPADVAYIETHGTGTPLGDPIELAALRNVYTRNVDRKEALLLGGLKAQIGHLECTAGVAALIKSILVLRNKHVPAQANFETPNPRFRWNEANMEVPRAGKNLEMSDPIVGISAFGLSGTNCHMLVSAAPKVQKQCDEDKNSVQVVTLSAKTEQALVKQAKAFEKPLGDIGPSLAEIAQTANLGRSHFNRRLALVGASKKEMRESLAAFQNGVPSGQWHQGEVQAKTKIAFLFSGQGGWKPGVGSDLYSTNPFFRASVDECLALLPAEISSEVSKAILDDDNKRAFHQPGQLAHFILQYALATTWKQIGIAPDLVIGHSLGEHAAAVVAGVMTLADGLKLVEARGRLFHQLCPAGAMLSVSAEAKWIESVFPIGEDIFISVYNGPDRTVLSGTFEAITRAQQFFTEREIRNTLLDIYDTPAHSPLLKPILAPFAEVASSVMMKPPLLPMISTLTGDFAGKEIAEKNYWVDMIDHPVRFSEALQRAAAERATFLEIGPTTVLTNLARAAAGDWSKGVSSLGEGPDDQSSETIEFAHACARLFCAGHSPDWYLIYGTRTEPVELPNYPFEKIHIETPIQTRVEYSDRRVKDIPLTIATPENKIIDTDKNNSSSDDTLALVLTILKPIIGEVEVDTPLVHQGFDSLAIMAMRARLQKHTEHPIPTSVFLAGGTLRNVAEFYAKFGIPAAPMQEGPVESNIKNNPICKENSEIAGKTNGISSTVEENEVVITLKDGSGPIVALVHPVGGTVHCYYPFAKLWPTNVKILVLQHPAVHLDAATPAYVPHEKLAEFYRQRLEEVLGSAPDFVGGWSFGASIAHNMVAQWEAGGVSIAGLFAIDGPLENKYIDRARAFAQTVKGKDGYYALSEIIADPNFRNIFDDQHGLDRLRESDQPELEARMLQVHAANMLALADHKPGKVQAPYYYALAKQNKINLSIEEVEYSIKKITKGCVFVRSFEGDHFSIMADNNISNLIDFFSRNREKRKAEKRKS